MSRPHACCHIARSWYLILKIRYAADQNNAGVGGHTSINSFRCIAYQKKQWSGASHNLELDLPGTLSTCGSMQNGKADMTRAGGPTIRSAHHFTDNCQDGRTMLGWADLIVRV
jgi:hypothetical protein